MDPGRMSRVIAVRGINAVQNMAVSQTQISINGYRLSNANLSGTNVTPEDSPGKVAATLFRDAENNTKPAAGEQTKDNKLKIHITLPSARSSRVMHEFRLVFSLTSTNIQLLLTLERIVDLLASYDI